MEKKSNVIQPVNGVLQIGVNVARGIKNNNPFNMIKTNISWFGKLSGLFNTDSKFEQFETLNLGIRAGLINLKNGYKLKGYNTVNSIISRYAPLSDNSPASQKNYISAVALGVFGSSVLAFVPLVSSDHWLKLAYGILKFENGVSPVTYSQLKNINDVEKIII